MMRNSHSFDNDVSSKFEFQSVKKGKLKLFDNFPKSLVLVLDKHDFHDPSYLLLGRWSDTRLSDLSLKQFRRVYPVASQW